MQQLSNNKQNHTEKIENSNEQDIFSNIRYVCQSCTLITESLKKGCDVLQMPDGDVIVTETKVFTYHYSWDDGKGKFSRTKSDKKSKKLSDSSSGEEENEFEHLRDDHDLEDDNELDIVE